MLPDAGDACIWLALVALAGHVPVRGGTLAAVIAERLAAQLKRRR